MYAVRISVIWTEHSCLVSYLKYETKQLKFENFFKHGFKTAYLENEELQRWFKRLFCLALIPIPALDDQITLLQTQLFDLQDKYPRSITEGRCHRFKNYFINTYVEGYFLKIMWNHYCYLI